MRDPEPAPHADLVLLESTYGDRDRADATVAERRAVLGREIAAPQGRIGIDYKNSHAELWTRIGKADDRGRFDILRESMVALRPDPFLVT